jgi:membrane-bound lytic murein transglycosylase B
MKKKLRFMLLIIVCLQSLVLQNVWASTYREAKKNFIHHKIQEGYSDHEVKRFLNNARKNEVVLDAIQKSWESQPWHKYYPIFLTKERINAGVAFWKKYKKYLSEATDVYKVEPEIIVSIIGIETFYGRNMGSINVRDALYSIGFYHRPRALYFQTELSYFYTLCKRFNLDPKEVKGSYAGAMGYGQFMPSSYKLYGVDFNHDGKTNLMEPEDSIGSVAHYFQRHGWIYGTYIAEHAELHAAPKSVERFLWDGKPPSLTLQDWKRKSVFIKTHHVLANESLAVLVKLKHEKRDEYWLGLQNFYVITRYNRSQHYAFAVIMLAKAIKTAYRKLEPHREK